MAFFQPDPLRGQRALVTGGSSGIGAAVARALAQAGARVVVNYLVPEGKLRFFPERQRS